MSSPRALAVSILTVFFFLKWTMARGLTGASLVSMPKNSRGSRSSHLQRQAKVCKSGPFSTREKVAGLTPASSAAARTPRLPLFFANKQPPHEALRAEKVCPLVAF